MRHLHSYSARALLRSLCLACLVLASVLTGCQSAPTAAVSAVKLLVETDGPVEVSAAALRAAGFDLMAESTEDLALSAGGQPVAFALKGKGAAQVLRFYGQALGPEAYTSQNVYWLRHAPAETDTPRITERSVAPATGIAATETVSSTVRLETQSHYRGQAGVGEDRWVGETLYAPAKLDLALSAPHLVAGDAQLRVQIVGSSSDPVTPDHHLLVSLNGIPVADVTWDGQGVHVITATVPAIALRADKNQLTLTAPGDTGAAADAGSLDWVELTYQRKLALTEAGLVFEGAAAGYAVAAAVQPAILWDITDPLQPAELTDTVWADGELRFGSDGAPRRFVVAPATALRPPAAVLPATSPDLHDWPGGADMIIVTVPAFRAALEPLVAARTAQRLRVAVVDVGQVYDSFSDGRADPAALRALAQYALAHWPRPAPRLLLLAGDASYDPRGYLQGAEVDLVPTRSVRTTYSGWTGSDVWYALPDDGPTARPGLAVGRFPAQTAAQLADMVAKTLAYEQVDPAAGWRKNALLVADNDESGFATEAAAFAAGLHHYTTQEIVIDGDGSAARNALLQGLDAGMGLIGYFGHGSPKLWAQEKVLSVEDVAGLTNQDKLSVVFTVTCLSGLFEHPTTPSLGEELVRAKNGGAVAALVPSSAAVLGDQRLLAEQLAIALSGEPQTLGEALLVAQTALGDTSGGVRDILLTFNLLGDPAVRLAR